MRLGKIVGTAEDESLATSHGFQVGDIVFRLGSRALARMIGTPVTHGGVRMGGGLIHDLVGFGTRYFQVVK